MEKYLKEFENEQKELIHILHKIQAEYGYIPPDAITAISKHLKISESEIYGVLTFYKAFCLEPRGEHIVTVCMGTACHVRGALQILDEFKRLLGIDVEETTSDNQFTLETVNCLGACALGPIAVIDKEYHGQLKIRKVEKLIKKYRDKDESNPE